MTRLDMTKAKKKKKKMKKKRNYSNMYNNCCSCSWHSFQLPPDSHTPCGQGLKSSKFANLMLSEVKKIVAC